MKKIQMIEEPMTTVMMPGEMEQTLGGFTCNIYVDPWIGTDECDKFSSIGDDNLCSGNNAKCNRYTRPIINL